MILVRCDHCGATAEGDQAEDWWLLRRLRWVPGTPLPILTMPTVSIDIGGLYDADEDETPDERTEDEMPDVELHFCGPDCLAAWAALAASMVDGAPPPLPPPTRDDLLGDG